MKIAYIGLDLFFPTLEALDRLGCEIVEIFTCETDNITEFNVDIIHFAKEHNIPYTTKRITVQDIERLKQKGCHMAICGGYYFKIPIDKDLPMVNIHPSLLPMGRGSWPMPISILRGDKKSGVTIHKIAEGFDTGDILLQESFDISKKETLKTFMDKACGLAVRMMKSLTENFNELYENAIPQGEGEYLEAPTERDWTVTDKMTVDEADVILRAFYGYECVYRSEDSMYVMINARAVRTGNTNKVLKLKDGYIEAERILRY